MVMNGKRDVKKMQNNKLREWIEKNKNYDVTLDEYINNSGTTTLYNDSKYMLTRVDTPESTAIASVPSELCLAFPTDKSIEFENPIDEFLENFFIYAIHLIENSEKMHETELLGVTPFKTIKENKDDIRYWPPIQGPGDDLYYMNLEDCVLKENMNKSFLDLPIEMWDIFYNDLNKQRKSEKK